MFVVLEKAQKILTENSHYNNRDLIREFFQQNPHYNVSVETSEVSNNSYACKPKKVTILGAGPSGLIAALVLAREGHQVCVYEKRSHEEFAQRWQNVAINIPQLVKDEFPELDKFLKDEQLINYEMELGDPTQLRSYRIALGDLQNALVHMCRISHVDVRYGENLLVEKIPDAQIVLITIPFRSVKALSQLVRDFDSDTINLERYNQQTNFLAQELFIKTLLVTLF